MEWRPYIYFGLLLLLLWLGPYVSVILQQDFSKTPPDTSASDRRLLRFCVRGLVATAVVLLLCWWLG